MRARKQKTKVMVPVKDQTAKTGFKKAMEQKGSNSNAQPKVPFGKDMMGTKMPMKGGR